MHLIDDMTDVRAFTVPAEPLVLPIQGLVLFVIAVAILWSG